MSLTLQSLTRCFQGLIPSTIATCSKDGVPNVTPLSQVYYVDPDHVALSCQFFNKTRRNVEENPSACVEVYDPKTLEAFRLTTRYVRSEKTGALFDAMDLRIRAIASITGMEGVFRLLSADVYRVLAIEPVPLFGDSGVAIAAAPLSPYVQVQGVGLVSQRINQAPSMDDLLETLLASLEDVFGITHSMILVPDDRRRLLTTLASHGYGEEGVGAEVAFGEGILGAVAEQKRVLRISHLEGDLRYGRTIRDQVSRQRAASADATVPLRPEIPLPGLPDAQSQLALPLLVQDRLVGVLALEDRAPMAFDEWDETLLNILANQVAIGIDKRERREEEELPDAPRMAARKREGGGPRRVFTFFRNDDCVFVDDQYLIRNVPGLILWKLLNAYQQGRAEFSNRELRLDPGLKLPELRDNLESRLVLLRKRLEQKCPDVRLVPVQRGRFSLDVRCKVELVEKATA